MQKKSHFTNPVFILILALLCIIFTFIAANVVNGNTPPIDTTILLSLRNPIDADLPYGPQWFQETVRDISALGSNSILWLITLLASIHLFLMHKPARAIHLLAAVSVGTIAVNLLKLGFARSRPDIVPHSTLTDTASFPSSHSMMAVVVYLTLGLMLAQNTDSRTRKTIYICLAVLLPVLIGISRIYLGVHWPSDVLGGWIAGLICTTLFWVIGSANIVKRDHPTQNRKYPT